MKAMERFMGPSNTELDKHFLTYNVVDIIKPLLCSTSVDLSSVSKKKSMASRGSMLFSSNDGVNYDLFDRLYDAFFDQSLNKRQSTIISSSAPSVSGQNDLTVVTDSEPVSAINSEESTEDEFDESEFDISVLQINTAADDAVFEKIHGDVKDRILVYLQTLLATR
jgi:hypothetical protein